MDPNDLLSAADRLAPLFAGRAASYDESGRFPAEDFDDIREADLHLAAVPAKFGGLGPPSGYAGTLPYEIIRRVSRGSSSTGWSLMVHFHQCGVIARLGSEEQAGRVFKDVVESGALIGSAGSEVNPSQSKASADIERTLTYDKADVTVSSEGLVVNGTKHFCTLAPEASYFLYWAIAPGAAGAADGLFNAIIPARQPGVTMDSNGWENVIGQRTTATWSVSFDEIFVPWSDVLGQPGDWVQQDTYTFELTMACQMLGTLEGAFDVLLTILRDRPFLMREEGVPGLVGEMSASLFSVEAAIAFADQLWESKRWGDAAIASLRALHLANDAMHLVCGRGYDIIGARSLFKTSPWERITRDARAASLHTRDSQVLRLIADGAVAGEYYVKQKYGKPVSSRTTWSAIV